MKSLTIQLMPELDTSLNEVAVIDLLKSISRYPEVDADDDGERFINLHLFTEDLPTLWADIKSALELNHEIKNWIGKVAVVACEGDEGWDDYLLLAHYDKSEKTVEIG